MGEGGIPKIFSQRVFLRYQTRNAATLMSMIASPAHVSSAM